MERTADAAARDSQKVKMAELYGKRIGAREAGVVSGCERFGVFVSLDETCADGLIPVRDLGHEWFEYDEKRMTVTGEWHGLGARPPRGRGGRRGGCPTGPDRLPPAGEGALAAFRAPPRPAGVAASTRGEQIDSPPERRLAPAQ